MNAQIGPFTVDFRWLAERLVVELDGWDSHGTRSAFEADRARDTELHVRGFQVIRFTWRQLTERPAEVAAALRELLRK